MDPDAVADQVEAQIRALGTPERAEGEKRYLKSDLDFLGASVSEIRRTVMALAADVGTLDHEGLV